MPNDLEENLQFRKELHEICLRDSDIADLVLRACMRDTHFWMKATCWVLEPRQFEADAEIPYLPWDCQLKAVDITEDAMRDGKDVLYDKSRDIGASWTVLHIFYKNIAFFRNRHFALGSRDEKLVDNGEDPSSLMWKLDFIHKHQPSYLKPPIRRTKLSFVVPWTNSTATGYAFSPNFARGGRYAAILLDEFAHLLRPGSDTAVMAATSKSTNTRIYVSSVQEASGEYFELREECRNNPPQLKPAEEAVLDWKDVPERRAGLYTSDRGQLIIIDKDYKFSPDYIPILDGRIRSPYYDEFWKKNRGNKRLVAKELDRDAIQAGDVYFDVDRLDELVLGAVEPYWKGRLYRNDQNLRIVDSDKGPLSLWCALGATNLAPDGEYGIGIDICGGTGTSVTNNSVACVIDRRTGEQVAEYVCNNERPREFAKSVYALCLMFHEPFVCWENNGGYAQNFARVLMKELRYFNVRYKVDDTKIGARPTNEPGWFNGEKGKETIFEPWFDAMSDGTLLMRSAKVFAEAKCYINGPEGKVIFRSPKSGTDMSEAGKAHGDRVVAAALSYLCMKERPVERSTEIKRQEDIKTHGAPFGSYAHTLHIRKLLKQNGGSLTNFG